MFICMHIHMAQPVCGSQGQFVGVGFFFPPGSSWGLNSRCQAWQQTFRTAEPSHWFLLSDSKSSQFGNEN